MVCRALFLDRPKMKSLLLALLTTQIVYAGDDRLGVGTHFSQNWDPTAIMPLIAVMHPTPR